MAQARPIAHLYVAASRKIKCTCCGKDSEVAKRRFSEDEEINLHAFETVSHCVTEQEVFWFPFDPLRRILRYAYEIATKF